MMIKQSDEAYFAYPLPFSMDVCDSLILQIKENTKNVCVGGGGGGTTL